MKYLAVLEAADKVAYTVDTGEGTVNALGAVLGALEAANSGR